MLSFSGLSPSPGDSDISLNSTIEFVIVDDGSGINLSSLIVVINGQNAVYNGSFLNDFNGTLSQIIQVGQNLEVVIDPINNFSIGSVISIKIQVKNNNESFYNYEYSFKTIPNEPVLIESNPENNSILVSPQILSFEFEDVIDGIDNNSFNFYINDFQYITNSTFNNDYLGPLTSITTTLSSTTLVKIDLLEWLRDGDYTIKYNISDNSGNKLIKKVSFSVLNDELTLPISFSQTGFLGWFQGIKRVTDYGIGDTLFIEWNTPIKTDYKNDVFVLTYENSERLNLFTEDPKYIGLSTTQELTISGLETGKTLSYGCRSIEFPAGSLDVTGMSIASTGVFLVPEPTKLASPVLSADNQIVTLSSDGYPDKGYLLLGNQEVVYYNSLNRLSNTFSLPANSRALYNTSALNFSSNENVKLFLSMTDSNEVIIFGTPTYQDGYSSGRIIDLDGVVTTDYTDNDRFIYQGFDFCGYHHPLPENVLQGKNNEDCGSYLGGEFAGMRGFNIYDRMLGQEEVQLNQTGEPMVLLKRIWSGTTCDCANGRKMHPKVKSCQDCYGTLFDGGYNQYQNLRRADRRIMVKVDEAAEDLYLGEHQHLEQSFEPNAWTMPMPAIKDRDLLVRFDITNDIEFIYIVLNVSREKIFYGQYGRQRLSLKRLDKTDIAYTFPLDLSRI